MRKTKLYCLVLFITLAQNTKAQIFTSILKKYEQQLDNTPKEYTFLHTDRDVYEVGDEILYNAFFWNEIDSVAISKVGYIYLCNESGKVLQKQIVKIKNKKSNNIIAIPRDYSTGTYFLITTTLWMQNFSKPKYFKKIFINNNNKPLVKEKKKEDDDFEVGFFPESGNLIIGANQLVGVRSISKNGNAAVVDFVIKSTKGETLYSGKTNNLGLANFNIIVENEGVMQIECVNTFTKKKKIYSLLPDVNLDNSNITINNQKKIFIQLNKTNKNEIKKYLLIGQMNGSVVFSKECTSINDNTSVINKADLPTGILAVMLVNEEAQIEAIRYVWVNNSKTNIKADITFSKKVDTVYRNEGVFSLKLNKDVQGIASVSITRANLVDTNQLNLYEYSSIVKTLGNVLDYNIEELKQIFASDELMDNVLITNGWKKPIKASLLEDETIKYAPENGIFIAGKITKAQLNTPIKNGKLDLIILNSDSTKYLFSETTNEMGEFIFRDIQPTKNATIFYNGKKVTNLNTLTDVTFYKHFTDTLKSFNISTSLFESKSNLTNNSADNIIRSKYKYLEEARVTSKRTTDIQKFDLEYVSALFENADQSIIIDKQIGTIWQVLQRSISGLVIDNTDSGKVVSFGRYAGADAFSENGSNAVQFFLNEQPISQFEMEGIFIEDIAYIKVFKGGLGYVLGAPRGAICFYTIKGKNTKDWRDKGFTKFDMQGYEAQYTSYNMSYSKVIAAKIEIDFRPTIYWNPSIVFQNTNTLNLSFYTDDYKGPWLLQLQGLTNYNEPFYLNKKVE